MSALFLTILHMSVCASWLVLAVLLLRLCLRRAPKWFNVLLGASSLCGWFSRFPSKAR